MPKTFDEDKECVINSIPKPTGPVYKNKWTLQIFREWQDQRANKICTIEPGVVFKGEDIGLDDCARLELTELLMSLRTLHHIYYMHGVSPLYFSRIHFWRTVKDLKISNAS